MTYTQVTGNRPARILVTILAVAVLIAAAAAGGYWIGHHNGAASSGSATAAGTTVGAAVVPASAAGPARIVGGIPSGYSDDRDGAIAAAIGFLQTGAMVDSGRVTPTDAATDLLSSNPSAAAVAYFQSVGDPTPTAGIEQVFLNAPVAVKVLSFTTGAAQLSFWSCFTGGIANNVGLPVIATTNCTVENVALSWERGDWKTADYQYTSTLPATTTVTSLVHDQGYHVLAGAFTVLTVGQP